METYCFIIMRQRQWYKWSRPEIVMYKTNDNFQSDFLRFNQELGLYMNPNNRWIKMADSIPWE